MQRSRSQLPLTAQQLAHFRTSRTRQNVRVKWQVGQDPGEPSEIRSNIKHIKDVHKFVEETLEVKAVLTVATRAHSFKPVPALGQGETDPYPFVSEAILEFLRCQTAKAPTRATRFLEAAAFAGALFGLEVDHIFSPQARWIAAKGLMRKRETTRMEPFAVRAVTDFELFLVKFRFPEEGAAAQKEQVAKAVFVGCLLWTVHGRCRFADMARIVDEPVLDVCGGSGYAETKVRSGRHKTGYRLNRWGKSLPQVVCAHGVSGLPWVESWLAIRKRAGRHAAADQCLLPELLADWSYGPGRITTSAGYGLLKAIMDEFKVAGRDNIATHSGKATVLSWCAKAGMTKSTRRLLAGHVDPADRSVVTYSRDALQAQCDSCKRCTGTFVWVRSSRTQRGRGDGPKFRRRPPPANRPKIPSRIPQCQGHRQHPPQVRAQSAMMRRTRKKQ